MNSKSNCILIILSTVMALPGLIIACDNQSSISQASSEFSIPNYFTSYTDENGIFSISYPKDWKKFPADLWNNTFEKTRQSFLQYYNSDVISEGYFIVFVAGNTGNPSVNIVTQPYSEMIKQGYSTLNAIVDRNIQKHINDKQEFREIQRIDVNVSKNPAKIIEWVNVLNNHKLRTIELFLINNKYIWKVTCGVAEEQYQSYSDDLYKTVQSLRILK
jgi:hypothetical protein